MAQTTIQNPNSLIAGSGILYIGEDWNTLINVGAIRDFVYNQKSETSEIVFDNVENIKRVKNFDKVSFEFKLAEIYPEVWKLFNKGLVNIEYVNGTTQTVTGEQVVLEDNRVSYLANKNGDGTRVSNIVVKSVGGGTTYTEGTDYEVVVNELGQTGLVLINGGGISSGDTVEVDYEYTPAQYKKITLVSNGLATPVVARFEHTDPSTGKKFTIDIENVSNIKTLGIDFVGDNEDDIATMDIELEGYLKEIRDELTV